MRLYRAIISLFLGLLMSACSTEPTTENASLESAQELLTAGKFDAAMAQYQLLAKSDDPVALNSIGMFFQLGWGRPVDEAKACTWFGRAAKADVPYAAFEYGRCAEKGLGEPTNLTLAVQRYQLATELNYGPAWCQLADLYWHGSGVEKKPRKAIELCRAGLSAGSINAYLKLAAYHRDGPPEVNDPALSRLYLQAAQEKLPAAAYQLGKMYRDGVGGPVDNTAAIDTLNSAASRGVPDAYLPAARLIYASSENLQSAPLPAQQLANLYVLLRLQQRYAEQQKSAADSEVSRMYEAVMAVMPESWQAELDTQVAEFYALVKH